MSRLTLLFPLATLTTALIVFNGCGAPPAPEGPEPSGIGPAPELTATAAADAPTPTATATAAEPAPAPTAAATAPTAPTTTAAATAPAEGPEKKPDAPPAATSAPAATGGLDVPGANITMASITVDGLTMTDFACQAGGGLGALLAGPTMAGMLSKKKAALKACSPKAGTVRVRWTAAGGKVTKAESKAATPQIEACVTKAVSSVPATMDGTCAATIDLGK
jgi:hypothetical protein